MPHSIARLALSALLLSLASHSADAQDAPRGTRRDTTVLPAPGPARTDSVSRDAVVVMRLLDGSVLYGRILSVDSTRLRVRTVGGLEVDVQRDKVSSMTETRGRRVGTEFWAEDVNGTRLLFTSTGRALGKGEGYVATYFLFFPFVAYGVTDRLTIAGGTPVIPGAIGRAFYLAPKVTVAQTERAAYSIGALSFALTEELAAGTVGLLYGVGTWGSRDNAVTAGLGWGYAMGRDDGTISNAPVLVLGGETRVSRRVKLVTENWFYTGTGNRGGLLSGGFRFLGDRLSSDLGFIGGVGSDDVACCFPSVNFVWNFGRKKK